MKIENKFITIALLAVVIMFSLVSFKGEKPKTETKVITETVSFVNQNMSTIKVYIDSYAKQGYTVKLIISQNVSVTRGGLHQYSEMKGDIILVMERQKTVTVTIK